MNPTPATMPGRCCCCDEPYKRGDKIVYDTTVHGMVRAEHKSAAAK